MEYDELKEATDKLCETIQKCCDKINEINADLEAMIDELKYGWHPNDFDIFYVPEPRTEKGYVSGIWAEGFQDLRKETGVFKTPEEAEAKARKLGYIK